MVAVSLKKFFFKQKTAYEIPVGDLSSDVCSSDLPDVGTITYASGDTGGGSVGGGGSLGPIAGADTMILDLYRLNEC